MGFSLTSVLVAVAMVAPAMASDKALACDKWQRNLMVKGDFIKQVHQPDAHWCKKQCMMTEGCEASTFHKTGHRQGEVLFQTRLYIDHLLLHSFPDCRYTALKHLNLIICLLVFSSA